MDLSIKRELWKSLSSIDGQAAPRIGRISTVYPHLFVSTAALLPQADVPRMLLLSLRPPACLSSDFCPIPSARVDHDTHYNTITTVQSFISDGTSVMSEAKSVMREGTNLIYGN